MGVACGSGCAGVCLRDRRFHETARFCRSDRRAGAFGLRPGWLWAALAIAVEIGGSALVVAGRWVWLGAGGLGVLTAVAMLAANNFWALSGHDRFMALNSFFEHLGLIAGLVLVCVHATQPAKRT